MTQLAAQELPEQTRPAGPLGVRLNAVGGSLDGEPTATFALDQDSFRKAQKQNESGINRPLDKMANAPASTAASRSLHSTEIQLEKYARMFQNKRYRGRLTSAMHRVESRAGHAQREPHGAAARHARLNMNNVPQHLRPAARIFKEVARKLTLVPKTVVAALNPESLSDERKQRLVEEAVMQQKKAPPGLYVSPQATPNNDRRSRAASARNNARSAMSAATPQNNTAPSAPTRRTPSVTARDNARRPTRNWAGMIVAPGYIMA